MAENLSTKVKVNGKTLTVSEATLPQEIQRTVLIAKANQDPVPKFYEGFDDEVITAMHHVIYPSLVSCSSGKVPTEEEFFHLPRSQAKEWINAVNKHNPDWLPAFVSEQKKDSAEKNA